MRICPIASQSLLRYPVGELLGVAFAVDFFPALVTGFVSVCRHTTVAVFGVEGFEILLDFGQDRRLYQ